VAGTGHARRGLALSGLEWQVVSRWYAPGSIGGLGMAVLAGLAMAAVLVGRARGRRYLVAAVGGALVFQLVHLAEHGAQVTYWAFHRDAPTYLTPWAASARAGLAFWCEVLGGQGQPLMRGTEVLHLAGNFIFLAGMAAAVLLAHGTPDLRARRISRRCAWVQGLHVAEHLVLTATLFYGGTARGVSTLFGAVPPASPGGVALRIWFHFALNLAATVLALATVRELRRADALQVRAVRPLDEAAAAVAGALAHAPAARTLAAP
jgi:hypothetical protein